MPASTAALAAIHRYPVKGLAGQDLAEVTLREGEGLPCDRRFALTNTVSSTMNGQWMACDSFFINALHDGLLRFETTFDEASGTVRITSPHGGEIAFAADDPASLERASSMLSLMLEPLEPVMPPLIAARSQMPGMASGYWDFTNSAVSLINLASVRALSAAIRIDLDPSRFRGNLLIDGLEPWEEFSWAGKRITIGKASLDIIRPALRCPATSVNPAGGARDVDVPGAMQEHFGHAWMGMYARVSKGGKIAPGAHVSLAGPSGQKLHMAEAEGAPDYRLWPKGAIVTMRKQEGADVQLALASGGPWELPAARPGQRLRLHAGAGLWTSADVASHEQGETRLEIPPSTTGDPATTHLREALAPGDAIIVTGPFGKAGS